MTYPTKLVLSGLAALAILALVGCAPGRRRLRVLACVGAGLLSAASATGAELEVRIGSTENFNILASTPELLKWSKERCAYWRREIALEWLGEELKPGEGYSHWHIEESQSQRSAKSLPKHGERPTMVWVVGNHETLEASIAHESVHVAFAERELPVWLEEGIACRYDLPRFRNSRARMLANYEADSWPSVRFLLSDQEMSAGDMRSYTLSESLVEYLLTLGSKQQLIAFASDKEPNALWRHYQILGADDLEARWKKWRGL